MSLAVVEAARKLIGTPFVHQGRVPGVGIDCAGLVILAGRSAGLHVEEADPYRLPAHRYAIEHSLERMSDEIDHQDAKPGDILVFWVRRPDLPQHLAIYAGNGRMIVVEHDQATHEREIPSGWHQRLYSVRRYKGSPWRH